jgi:hypothetical protein
MTPKEKAIELVDNFSNFTIQESWQSKNYFAIECALIAVDEILRSHHNLYGVNNKEVKFYSEVQQEIEKL